MASTVFEITWFIGLLDELNMEFKLLVKLFTMSKLAMQIVINPVFHERTKHIEIDCYFIRKKSKRSRSVLLYLNH